MPNREIKFVEDNQDIIINNIKEYYASGHSKYFFIQNSDLSKKIENEIIKEHKDISFELIDLEKNIDYLKNNNSVLVLIDNDDTNKYLLKCIHLKSIKIIVILSGKTANLKPLYIVSIPKSGTHLLHRLIKAFGYDYGGEPTYSPHSGKWYSLEYSNTHTGAKDFFIDSVRRSPFGNRDHPFPSNPCIFIYRNPMDIVVSEANYYHKDGATLFSGYLKNLSFDERLDKLIDDPWLLGSIRKRIGNFIAYLNFPNVIPVSFEELIGTEGGGDKQIQEDLIWSLQLKLHISGNPEKLSASIFDNTSPTFHSGKVCSYKDKFTEKHYKKFLSLNQDFMECLGYEVEDKGYAYSSRIKEFRERPLELLNINYSDNPILIESDYHDFNIVKYNNKYFAIPLLLGELSLDKVNSDKLNTLPNSHSYKELKEVLRFGDDYPKLIRLWQRKKIISEFNKDTKNKLAQHPYNLINKILGFLLKVSK